MNPTRAITASTSRIFRTNILRTTNINTTRKTMSTTSSPHQPPHILLGTANWGSPSDPYNTTTTPTQAQKYLDILKAHNLKTIDTSRNYPAGGTPGTSELLLGSVNASQQGFQIDDKVDNYKPGDHKYENVLTSVENELVALQTDKVRVEYLHWPDRSVPLEEPLRAMNKKYNEGKFERFGISNYSAGEVEKIVEICEKEGWIRPTVYQGQYNALCRRGEKQLFPTLRKLGFSFFAWSPAAGGSIGKESSKLTRKDAVGDMFRGIYGPTKPLTVADLAAAHNMSGYELAIRWNLYHSHLDGAMGDSVILGASRPEQFENTLEVLKKGPLEEELVKRMDEIWEGVEEGAPSYSPWVGIDGVTLVM